MLGKLRKLFERGPRLNAAAPEERIAALDKLGDDDQDVVASVFLEDDDRAVRLAALAHLTALEPLRTGLADASVASAVAERLAALLADDAPQDLRQHPLVCRAVLANATVADTAIAAAEHVQPVAERAAALADNARPDVRLAVAERSWAPDLLAALERAMRGRDKSVHRLAKERLASLKAATGAREQEDATTTQLVTAADQLRHDDPHYDARRDAIERDWQQHLTQIAATDATLAQFGVAVRDLEVTRGRFAARRPAPKPVAPPSSGAEFEPLVAAGKALAEAVSAMCGEPNAAAIAEFRQTAQTLRTQWSAAADAQPAEEATSANFRSLMSTIADQLDLAERAVGLAEPAEKLLAADIPAADGEGEEALAAAPEIARATKAVERLLQRYDWPEDAPPPAALVALRARREQLAAAAEQCAEGVAASVARIAEDIATLRTHMDAGEVHEAVALDRKLRDQVKALPPAASRSLSGELAEVGVRLRELRDWRNFAEVPRRQALCEQMEALAESPLEVQEQADAVRALRQQWNDLGSADSRKMWQLKKRFDRAAETAFQPCRDHFKDQAAQRTYNLQQRQAIVAALESYLAENDWQNADWPGVSQVLRQARAEWRQYYPMDRKAGKAVANRFEAVAAEIHALLKAEWDRNIERKEGLVAEAAEVRESGRTATDKANAMKTLQQRWKEVGPTPHKVGQRLWKQFRAECDVVFAARDAVRDQRNERRRGIEEAESLIDELERRADIDPALDRNTVAQYQNRIEDLDGLPNELKRRAASVVQYAERALADRR